ncbi:MAG: PEP-CTERM sorting domain-containing protein, partial [Candidatus Omnitrophota bacterium]
MGKRLIKNKIKILMLSCAVLALLFVLEPVLRNKEIFAVPFLTPSQSETQTLLNGAIGSVHAAQPVRHRTSAPEPATVLLMLGGITGFIVRSAKIS